MPHLTLEYTENISEFAPLPVLQEMIQFLVQSSQFEEIDIKTRAVELSTYCVGQDPESRGFVHVRLAILSGRSLDVRQQLSSGLLEVLRLRLPPCEGLHLQLCVEILEIERESYAKTVVEG